MQLYDTKIQQIFNPVRSGSWHHNTSFKDGSILYCPVIVLILGPRSPHTVLARLMKSAPLLPKLQFLIKNDQKPEYLSCVRSRASCQYRFPLFLYYDYPFVEGLTVINDPKCNKVLNVITFSPKSNKILSCKLQ